MPVPVATRGYEVGDFIIREGQPREFDASTVSITNSSSSLTWVMSAGQPLVVTSTNGIPVSAVPQIAASMATISGLLLDALPLPPSAVAKVAVFARGNGLVIDTNMMPTKDHLGAAITLALMKDGLTTWGAQVRDEPSRQESQAT